MLERLFKLRANDSNVHKEIVGGATAFMTLSYIIFVQPMVLSSAGMDMDAVMYPAIGAALIVVGWL